MKVININKHERINFLLYPDGQPHVNIYDIEEGDDVKVVCSILSSLTLLNLIQCSNALDNLFAKKRVLVIPYLMGARFDRLMQKGDSIDLKVVSDLINYCGFEKVYLFDVHSDTATMLIKNSVNIDNKTLVSEYNKEESILICPDAGAVKKVGKYFDWNKNIVDVVYCNKVRDLSNGSLTLNVLSPERCEGKNCVIIDDLCDGGGTFLGIASQINPKSLTLIVTHGVFSKGTKVFENIFDEIIVSDSFCSSYESKIIKTVKSKLW
jgi:ribose-phosphate pyrophosphokinase